jgi:hypothetical protein
MGAVTRHGKKVAEWVHSQAPAPEPVQQPERAIARTRSDSLLD